MKKILVVDDDLFIRDLVATKLHGTEYEVFTAPSVAEALGIFAKEKIDVILLDLDLPGDNGIKLLRHVRSDFKTIRLPVIIFSNNDGDDIKEEVMAEGATAFIVKVMTDMNELKQEIDRILA